MRDGHKGIYCQSSSIVATPDYAKRLVEEGGVDHFVIRSGYDFKWPEAQEKAVQIVRDFKVKVSFMVGVCWGGWLSDEKLPWISEEGQFRMDMPGAATEAKYIDKIERLCKTFQPDSLCLSHLRYRHAGYIDGIFDEGRNDADYQKRMEAAGIPRGDMLAARAAWENAIKASGKTELLKASEKGFVGFLSALSESDALVRLLAFRKDTISESLRKYQKAVTDIGVSFGSNAFSPYWTMITGQDYNGSFAETCEFVQPLLCYMEWHRYQSIASLSRYLMSLVELDEQTAIQIAKNLLGMGDWICPNSISELDTCAEGTDESIYSFVRNEIKLCAPFVGNSYNLQIGLRGRHWSREVTDKLVEEAKSIGVDSFIFLGTDYLTKVPTPVIDGLGPNSGWF